MSFINLLKKQLTLYPCTQPQDAVKLCYQAAFGAEHLLQDITAARKYFDCEYSSIAENDHALAERISLDFYRVNLSAWKMAALPREWLFNMFRATASNGAAANANAVFSRCLQAVGLTAERGEAPFTLEAWNSFMDGYDRLSPSPVHHSETYRESAHPSYRIVADRFARLIPLLKQMAEISQHSETNIIAIDGRAASGKTTLATALAEVTGAGIIHMDDFFLPGALRTEARLATPGGNVHYERFLTEVIPCLSGKNAFSYQTFDCEKMRLGELRHVSESAWRIVEGAYSCHPELGGYMGVRVFCNIAPDEQFRRICKRDGEGIAAVFKSQWIPMEELYFNTYKIEDLSDILL